MFSIIAFIIVIFGCLNWLSIGFFQYDIVAGLFGYQGSIFSRIVYIAVGIAALFITFIVIKNKGKLIVRKHDKHENSHNNHNLNEQNQNYNSSNAYNNTNNQNSQNGNYNNNNHNNNDNSNQNNVSHTNQNIN